jgi:hypothetical protein
MLRARVAVSRCNETRALQGGMGECRAIQQPIPIPAFPLKGKEFSRFSPHRKRRSNESLRKKK